MCASLCGGAVMACFLIASLVEGVVFTRAGWTLWTLMCPPVVYEPFRTHAPPTHTHVQSKVHVTIYSTVERICTWTIPYPKAKSFIFSQKWCFFALLPHSCVWTCPHSYRPKMNTRHRVKGALGGRACCWHSFNIFIWLLKKSIIPVLCFSLIITNNIQSRTLAHSNCDKMTHAYSKWTNPRHNVIFLCQNPESIFLSLWICISVIFWSTGINK